MDKVRLSKRFYCFAICCMVIVLGLALFGRGFFLTRVELKNEGACTSSDQGKCMLGQKYDKVVIIVIDALRLDFVLPTTLTKLRRDDASSVSTSADYYLNKLTVLRDLVEMKPKNTFLARLDADPPTTTMQRLKGIATGGLPTFIDIKDDVASEKIFEDNIILQLKQRGKRVTFMGDDTWVKLFPDSLTKKFPYDSFNVKDLDTLDNGVISHLAPEMAKNDWDVLVAHFLGVDHAGHRYGPRHPEMGRKLKQMDEVLSEVVGQLDDKSNENTLLLVFGDHGMTEDGNHGGATDEERSAALFAYSPHMELQPGVSLEAKSFREGLPTIQQIDLAPTLALLLDIPIPFGSLGFFVPDILGSNPVNWKTLIDAALINTQQIINYLRTYSEFGGSGASISSESLKKFEDRLLRVHQSFKESGGRREEFESLRQISRDAADEARSLWTQFNMPLMIAGITFCVMGVFGQIVLLQQPGTISSFLARPLSFVQSLPVVIIVGWIIGLLALISNSYINGEAGVSLFIMASTVVTLLKSPRMVCSILVCLRMSLIVGDWMRSNGHEVRDFPSVLFLSILPLLLIVGLRLRRHVAQQDNKLTLVVCLQTVFAISFWGLSIAKLPANMLAQATYFLTLAGLHVATDFAGAALVVIIPLSLILGPAGSLAIVGYFFIGEVLSQRIGQKYSPVWQGVALAQLSTLWFFVMGHSCVFGTLRITAPYVGFEEFGYWRGAIMLTLDTFSAHLLGSLASLHFAGIEGLTGYLTVFASRALVSTCFVLIARRHLMVWAIFAPKFIFDASAYAACVAFSSLLVLLGQSWQNRSNAKKV